MLWLIHFVTDLMLLKPDLEEEFEETRKIITSKHNKNMRTYSKGSLNFIDSLNREYFGSTMDEKDEKIRAMIIRCHTQMKMSVKEIAEFAGETVFSVRKVLKSQNLIP